MSLDYDRQNVSGKVIHPDLFILTINETFARVDGIGTQVP